MIIRQRRALEGDAQQRAEIVGERHGINPGAADDAGIAVGRLLAGPAPVDERDGKPALGELQCGRRADDAGAENHYVRACHCEPRVGRPERRG